MEQEKGFNPTFENGGFWEYYKDLEQQFESYLFNVPYLEGNEKTYSFRLANLLLAIGAHIDSAFKEIGKYTEFSSKYPEILNPKTKNGKKREPNIRDYLPISTEYELNKRIVMFKCLPNRKQVSPFQQYQLKNGNIEVPNWWTAYNKVKHNFSKNFAIANIKTIRDALTGAFLLNVVHKPAILRLFKYGVAKSKYPEVWSKTGGATYSMRPTVEIIQNILEGTIHPPLSVETNLFYFDCESIDINNV